MIAHSGSKLRARSPAHLEPGASQALGAALHQERRLPLLARACCCAGLLRGSTGEAAPLFLHVPSRSCGSRPPAETQRNCSLGQTFGSPSEHLCRLPQQPWQVQNQQAALSRNDASRPPRRARLRGPVRSNGSGQRTLSRSVAMNAWRGRRSHSRSRSPSAPMSSMALHHTLPSSRTPWATSTPQSRHVKASPSTHRTATTGLRESAAGP